MVTFNYLILFLTISIGQLSCEILESDRKPSLKVPTESLNSDKELIETNEDLIKEREADSDMSYLGSGEYSGTNSNFLESIVQLLANESEKFPNLNIKEHLANMYKETIILLKKDKKLNNMPLMFYSAMYPVFNEYQTDTNESFVDSIIIDIDHMLENPMVRHLFGTFVGFRNGFREGFFLSNLHKEYLNLLGKSGLKDHEENKNLTANYKIIINNFIEILREEIRRNRFPEYSLQFLEKIKEHISFVQDLKNLQNNLSDAINSDISYLIEHLDLSKLNSLPLLIQKKDEHLDL